MPCSDYSDADTIHELSGQIKALTRVACELARHLKCYNEDPANLTTETRTWLKQHAEEDARRLEAEAAGRETSRKRKAALNKLTAEERSLLGLRRA